MRNAWLMVTYRAHKEFRKCTASPLTPNRNPHNLDYIHLLFSPTARFAASRIIPRTLVPASKGRPPGSSVCTPSFQPLPVKTSGTLSAEM